MQIALIAALAVLQGPVQRYEPSQTRVLIIPTLNLSGDKYLAMKEEQTREADATLKRVFGKRGFVVIDQAEASEAVKTVDVDLTDEENQRKDVMYRIGETAHADLVVFVVIDRTWQKTTHDFLMDKLEGFAGLKTWLLDVHAKKPILSAAKTEGRSTRNGPTGSLRQIRAVRIGIETQLKAFLAPYEEKK